MCLSVCLSVFSVYYKHFNAADFQWAEVERIL